MSCYPCRNANHFAAGAPLPPNPMPVVADKERLEPKLADLLEDEQEERKDYIYCAVCSTVSMLLIRMPIRPMSSACLTIHSVCSRP